MNSEQETTPDRSIVAEVIDALIRRVVELETRQINLERQHVELAGEFQKLAVAVKVQQDALEQKHERDQIAFAQIGETLERLIMKAASASGSPREIN